MINAEMENTLLFGPLKVNVWFDHVIRYVQVYVLLCVCFIDYCYVWETRKYLLHFITTCRNTLCPIRKTNCSIFSIMVTFRASDFSVVLMAFNEQKSDET